MDTQNEFEPAHLGCTPTHAHSPLANSKQSGIETGYGMFSRAVIRLWNEQLFEDQPCDMRISGVNLRTVI